MEAGSTSNHFRTLPEKHRSCKSIDFATKCILPAALQLQLMHGKLNALTDDTTQQKQ